MFFRLKVASIVPALVVTLLCGIYALFVSPVRDELDTRLALDVVDDAERLATNLYLDALTIRSLAEQAARHAGLGATLALRCAAVTDIEDCNEQRHRDGVTHLENWLAGAQAGDGDGAELTLLMIAEADGTVLARTLGDVGDWWGPNARNLVAAHPLVGEALRRGETVHGWVGWREEAHAVGALALVAAAPVFAGETPVGVVLLGRPVDDRFVASHSRSLRWSGAAVYFGEAVAGTSLSSATIREIDEATVVSEGGRATTLTDFVSSTATLARAVGQQDDYVLARRPLAAELDGPTGDRSEAYLLMVGRRSQGRAAIANLPLGLSGLGLLIIVVGLIALFVALRDVSGPLVAIDQGIQQVISGNRDYVWPANGNPLQADLAHSLNVMSAFLQGKPLPDEDGDSDREWEELLQFGDISGARPIARRSTGMMRQIDLARESGGAAEEPLELFHRRLFDDYVAARHEVGGEDDGLTYDRFVAQVRRNTKVFKEKHRCSDVRFQVVVKEGRVVLKPVAVP